MFFSALTLLEGKELSEVKEEIVIKFPPIFKVYWTPNFLCGPNEKVFLSKLK